MPNHSRFPITVCLTLAACVALPHFRLAAQTPPPPPKPKVDVLIMNDDEKLSGHFVRSNGGNLTFKSDMLGELTIPWTKVKELHATGPYTVVGKDVKLGRASDTSKLPAGSVDATSKEITVTRAGGAPPQTIALKDAAHVIETAQFEEKVMHTPGVTENWNGAVRAGAALVEATQQSRTFTGGFALVRAVPQEAWLDPRDRTTVDFNFVSGIIRQPATPEIKTNIIHADVERDQYFSTRRMYGFGQAAFDHNYSQGLDLGSQLGFGLGWTAIKSAANVLDVKTSVTYLHQSFAGSADEDKSLAASTFAELLTHKFHHGVVLAESASATPTWNMTEDWLANGSLTLTVPAYKRLNVALGLIEAFLNDPAPGFKKNSFQSTISLTYTLR